MAQSKPVSNKTRKNNLASAAIDARNDVARFDMACGLASLARPLKTGARREAFHIKQKWNGGSLDIVGVALSDYDLGVLLALIVLAEKQQPEPQLGSEISNLLPATTEENLAKGLEVVTINTSFAAIKKILGVTTDDGNTNDVIWESLRLLATTVVDARDGKRRAITHLISYGKGLEDSLSVTLSYRLTRALMGAGSYAAIKMDVFARLPRGTVRILYVWLSSWYGGALGARAVGINTLVESVWDDKVHKMTSSTLKDRRRVVREALQHIQSADKDWQVELNGDCATITRQRQ